MNNTEKRTYSSPVEVRADKPETKTIKGYAFLFNVRADLNWFEEEILPGAADGILKDDIRALFNHDSNHILGRSKANTLRTGIDAKGFWYEVDLPNTTTGSDLYESIQRGDINQSSFAFAMPEDGEGENWLELAGEKPLRQIIKFERILDVSPVTYPAYEETSVAARSLKDVQQTKAPTSNNATINSLIESKININK